MRLGKRKSLSKAIIVLCMMVLVQPSQAETGTTYYCLGLAKNSAFAYTDVRFGIAEHSLEEMALLGFPNNRFHSRYWWPQEEDSGVFFLLTSPRYDEPWTNDEGLCQWAIDHPGRSYIIGNELGSPAPIGSGLTPAEYAAWYKSSRDLILSCDSTARVGPYGPIYGYSRLLLETWQEYKALTGEPMPVDFYPIHYYAKQDFVIEVVTQAISQWVEWLSSHHGESWVGTCEYWLTEFGIPAWSEPVPVEESLRLMNELIPWLMDNTLNITTWAWWPSGKQWEEEFSARLVIDGRATRLGERYYELARGQ